jgi:6-pyruvoyltetrahydropterin/6-carboxytetrahydropterin synthase
MYELVKQFRFDAAHTLHREIETEGSRRIHGHSFRAEVTLRGVPEKMSGMIMDSSLVAQHLQDIRDKLDHRFLDEINDLGPATMENLCAYIWKHLHPALPGLHCVTVLRDSTEDRVSYYGSEF